MSRPVPDKSTTVRPKDGPLPLRLAFAALGAVSPSLAARAGEQLFLSPRGHSARRPRTSIPRGDAFVVPAGRERVLAWRFGDGPAVVLAHGWGGRGAQLASFVEPLVAAGLSAVSFDAPAHGGSTGRLTSGLGFAEAIAAVATRVGARAAIGHSLGAAGLAWAVAGGLRLDAAVLLAPPRGPAEFFHRFCEALALAPAVRSATRARLQRRLGIVLEEFDLVRVRAETPLLVVHDRDDREVPWTDGEEIARAWPGGTLLTTSGLGHRRLLRDPAVARRATSFVLERLARCDCGRPVAAAGATACASCALERELWHAPSRWVRA